MVLPGRYCTISHFLDVLLLSLLVALVVVVVLLVVIPMAYNAVQKYTEDPGPCATVVTPLLINT